MPLPHTAPVPLPHINHRWAFVCLFVLITGCQLLRSGYDQSRQDQANEQYNPPQLLSKGSFEGLHAHQPLQEHASGCFGRRFIPLVGDKSPCKQIDTRESGERSAQLDLRKWLLHTFCAALNCAHYMHFAYTDSAIPQPTLENTLAATADFMRYSHQLLSGQL